MKVQDFGVFLTQKKGNVCLEMLWLRLFPEAIWFEPQGPGLCAPKEMGGDRIS